ncbi:MAG: cell division protein FtsQ/DivIB [Bacteroidales bacterium]|nr:cell division protein FtsQ/DivIB [Bacteroidales bacterium]
MKISPRIIVVCSAAALLLAGFGLLGSCARSERRAILCDGLDVQIKDKYEFVTDEDIKGFVDKKYGTYIGVRLDSLDLYRLEKMLEEKGVVLKSEAWTTNDGILHISIQQRQPVLRFQRGDKGFYVDKEGFVFPLHSSYTADVPVIEGTIPSLESESGEAWARGVISLVNYIQGSKKWRERVSGISVNSRGDLELRVNSGKERFILGYPDKLDGKFARMDKYFSHILPAKGEGYYKSVNLKYNKQIICRKDI